MAPLSLTQHTLLAWRRTTEPAACPVPSQNLLSASLRSALLLTASFRHRPLYFWPIYCKHRETSEAFQQMSAVSHHRSVETILKLWAKANAWCCLSKTKHQSQKPNVFIPAKPLASHLLCEFLRAQLYQHESGSVLRCIYEHFLQALKCENKIWHCYKKGTWIVFTHCVILNYAPY